jgi:hypothetical protein
MTKTNKRNLTVPSRSQVPMRELAYSGHQITEKGIFIDPEKIATILKLALLQNTKELRYFNDVIFWYHRFVPNVATFTASLN